MGRVKSLNWCGTASDFCLAEFRSPESGKRFGKRSEAGPVRRSACAKEGDGSASFCIHYLASAFIPLPATTWDAVMVCQVFEQPFCYLSIQSESPVVAITINSSFALKTKKVKNCGIK